ncbi:DUF11 domain-containing protein [Methanobrevibacter filiformis]|uniref:Large cysteine-rich periplasmic protein OmcB n=1 Tax=Methanobrevibacter filiformis TaxID=55758 RepID=A0A166C7R0_9EURY|nr:DUF11 domain-containing protein [Methanobrevibacter filiformis]KZX14216.1 large cysteine-rich periplasmic protein OmcB precursor [Methanobrevibacter filiformis]
MKNKYLIVAIITVLFALMLPSTVFADEVQINNNHTVTDVTNNRDYDYMCVEEEAAVKTGDSLETTAKINTKDGVIEYIAANYNDEIANNLTKKEAFQKEVWKISGNKSIKNKTYPDNFKINSTKKIIPSSINSTIKYINGSKYNSTTWTVTYNEFTFRMAKPGKNTSPTTAQAMLIYNYIPYNITLENLTLIPETDLVITKTTNVSTVNIGNSVKYTITVKNNGPQAATQVKVTETLPTGVTLTSYSKTTGTYTSPYNVWDIGNLNVGQTATLILTVTAKTTGTWTNKVNVSGKENETNYTNNNDSVNITIKENLVDLIITKTTNTSTANIGNRIAYTITVKNNGPTNATGVKVTETLPTGVTYYSYSLSTGTYSSTTGLWTIGNLNVGQTATLILTVTAKTTGTWTNKVNVSGKENETNYTNNNATANITIKNNSIDLAITKTVNASTVEIGKTVNYTITVKNNGPANATGVKVTETLPTGVTYYSYSLSTGTYSSTAGLWTIGNLNVGQTATLILTVTAKTTGTWTNKVNTSGNENETNYTNNNATATIVVGNNSTSVKNETVDLAITKTGNVTSIKYYEQVAYTITVTNNGPGDATGVKVSETAPTAGVIAYKAQPSSTKGSYDVLTHVWTIGDLKAGESVTLTIRYIAILEQGTTTWTNIVNVSANENETNYYNNIASATVKIGSGTTPPGAIPPDHYEPVYDDCGNLIGYKPVYVVSVPIYDDCGNIIGYKPVYV